MKLIVQIALICSVVATVCLAKPSAVNRPHSEEKHTPVKEEEASPKADACRLSSWHDWGSCECSVGSTEQRKTYSKPAAKYDAGRRAMAKLMESKRQYHEHRASCLKDGTCPHLAEPASSGPFACVDGLAGQWPCRNADLASFINIQDLGYDPPLPSDFSPEASDLWGWTDPETGDEYVIAGLSGGTSFVRITDPENPKVVAFLYSRTSALIWRDMKVISNTAYIVSEAPNHGMQVFDLELLRGMTGESINYVEATAEYSEFGNAHNIVSNEETKFLYVVGATKGSYPNNCDGGLHVIDVSDRLNPKFVGCFDEDGYVHDAQCVIYHGPDANYQGQELCFCFNEDTFTIVDVTNKQNMVMVSKTGYQGYAYTHQGWLTEDHTICLLDDELDENGKPDGRTKTYIWDVTNLEAPTLQKVYIAAHNSIDHNQYVKGEYTYQSNYESGLRILHVDQATYSLNEVAYFDVFPSRNAAQFAGSWSNYPYFQSGIVPASGIEYGLFLLRPNQAEMKKAQTVKYAEQERTRTLLAKAKDAKCPNLAEHRMCDAKC